MNALMKLFHRHKWQTVSSAVADAEVGGLLQSTRSVEVLVKIEKCLACGKYRGIAKSATISQEMDVDYLVATSGGRLHK